MTAGPDHKQASAERFIISVDAMGGDEGPATVVAGIAISAAKNPEVEFILHGDSAVLTPLLAKRPRLTNRVTIQDAQGVITMDAKPSQVVRNGKDTSMWSTIESVKVGNASAAVSCGNTGALMALSMIRLRKLEGVNRPAIAVLWPSRAATGFNIMLDVGADVRADSDDLLKYALMGTSYARNGLGLPRPRVGLLNVGTEEHKGRTELKDAFGRIGDFAEQANYEFVGFVEGSDIPGDVADVIVTDGFTGNVAIKTGEGTASLIGDLLKQAFNYSIMSRLASLLALGTMKRLKTRIDPRHVNGGVFLGLNGTVVKSHGGADATGVSAAVQLAIQLAKSGFTKKLAARVATTLVAAQCDDELPEKTAQLQDEGQT